ncbi:EF-hand domain-containing protein [Tabrizicola flagellatus]|uniref:EF-hand domain-containing protein n=1 Tax=Tabrizicola flagellatus TaxID=2593021 RepID=UPI0011F25362|nr:EF-hand domain-containing protein [Tabrizicola flagellatus]
MKKIALVLAATALSATAVLAEDAAAPEVVDTDANGSFSLAEVQAVYKAVTEEAFKAADTDASGELSADELKAAVDSGAFKAE